MKKSLAAILLFATCGCTRGTSSPTRPLSLSVVGGEQTLVVPQPGNRYGFEGGKVIRVGATYYWFTTELTALPYWAKTTLALWTSADGQHWHRQATLFGPSSANQTGNDRRAALWAPIPVYDQNNHHWLIFYISYRSKPNLVNYDGEVWEAKSTIAGSSGISGPYIDVGVVLSEQIGSRQPWEVVQGDDSFEAFQLPDGSWRAFYGSANEHSVWQVGMLSAPDLSGPWTRLTGNPLPISSSIENPIVFGTGNEFIALYDDVSQTHNVACMWSAKGTIWSACPSLPAGSGVRTPVGLVPAVSVSPSAGMPRFLMFYTACSHQICDLHSELVSLRS